jgi:hypothetical protein
MQDSFNPRQRCEVDTCHFTTKSSSSFYSICVSATKAFPWSRESRTTSSPGKSCGALILLAGKAPFQVLSLYHLIFPISRMGGGEPKEVLLIVLPFAEDRSVTDKIREKFPRIEVKYHQLTSLNWSLEADQGLPEGCSVCSFKSICVPFVSSLRTSPYPMRGFAVLRKKDWKSRA